MASLLLLVSIVLLIGLVIDYYMDHL